MNVKLKLPRAYKSSLRDAQSAQTRERILQAAKDYLETGDLKTLTLRRIAELADVSAPTVYAYFPTMDDLAHAFFFWLKPHIGTDAGLPEFSEFGTVPQRMFPRYARAGRLLRNLMNTPAWDRLRAGDWKAKEAGWVAKIEASLPGLTVRQKERGAIALSAFATPGVWRWLVDIAGCPEAEAEQIAGWAMSALADALKRDASGLDDKTVKTSVKTSVRKTRTSS
jgi:AcrR family transcriptional regulator